MAAYVRPGCRRPEGQAAAGDRQTGEDDDGGQERVLVQFTIAVFGLLVEALRLNVSRLSLPR